MLNVGSMQNMGYEVTLDLVPIQKKNFTWNMNFNIAINRNKVTALTNDQYSLLRSVSWDQRFNAQYPYITQVGKPSGMMYGFIYEGTYKPDEFNAGTTLKDGIPYMTSVGQDRVRPGDPKYRDINKDGLIDDNDRTIVGKPSPDFTFGLTNRFTWGRWEFSFLLTGQTGGMIYSTLGRSVDVPKNNQGSNMMSCWKNMWVSEAEPGDGMTPGIHNLTIAELYNTRWLYSTDFIKIKNLSIGYRFKFRKSSQVKGLKVYLNAENLYMWDKYAGGFSPETNNGNLFSAYDYGAYPQARVISFGANLTF